jgi:hypothetical protein
MLLQLGVLVALLLPHCVAGQDEGYSTQALPCPSQQKIILDTYHGAAGAGERQEVTVAASVREQSECHWEVECADSSDFVQLTFLEFPQAVDDYRLQAPATWLEVLSQNGSTTELMFSFSTYLAQTYDYQTDRSGEEVAMNWLAPGPISRPPTILLNEPVTVRSSSVAMHLTCEDYYDGSLHWMTASARCVVAEEQGAQARACPTGSLRQYPWLLTGEKRTDRGSVRDRPPQLSPLLVGRCEVCTSEENCAGEGGCTAGAWGLGCEQCECTRGSGYGSDPLNHTHCYYAGEGGRCTRCAEAGPSRWMYDLAIVLAFAGLLVLAPVAIWRLSYQRDDAIDLTVKETGVATNAALSGAKVAAEAAKISAAVGAMRAASSSASTSAATVATTAKTAAAIIPHVQMTSISFEVDMQWPKFMTNMAEWFRKIVLFDFLSALDSVCTTWRQDRDRATNLCDLTNVDANINVDSQWQPVNPEVPSGLCIKRPPTGASPDQNYTLGRVIWWSGDWSGDVDIDGFVWRQPGHRSRYGNFEDFDPTYDKDVLAPWHGHDESDRPLWLQNITDLNQGRCTTNEDCVVMNTILHSMAREMSGSDPVIIQLLLKLAVFAAIVAVFVLLIYIPAGCVPGKHWPEKRLGSRDEVRQHAINAVAATHSLLIMVIANACFTATDVTTRSDGTKYLSTAPFIDSTNSPHNFYVNTYVGWLTTVLLVVAPPLWYYQKICDAGRLVAHWEVKDRKQAFIELLIVVPAQAEDSDGDSPSADASNGGFKHSKADLKDLTVNELRTMCEDEGSIAQQEISAADVETPTITIGRERWFPDFQRSYGFLYSRYDPWAWWYEAAASTRKILLVAFSVLLSERQVLYAISSMITLAYALRVQLRFKPFLDGTHTLISTPLEPDQFKVLPRRDAPPQEGPWLRLLAGAILSLSFAIVLQVQQLAPTLLTEGHLGSFLMCAVVLATSVGACCVGKLLLLLWHACTHKKARHDIVLNGQTIAVDGVPKDTEPEAVMNALVLQRDHVDEDASDSDADSADTLEQTSLIALFVMQMMGLLTYLVNLGEPSDKDIKMSADPSVRKSPVSVVITVGLTCVAMVAAIAPFAATYWLYKYPGDQRLARHLAPLQKWLAPFDAAERRLEYAARYIGAYDYQAVESDEKQEEEEEQGDDGRLLDSSQEVLPDLSSGSAVERAP